MGAAVCGFELVEGSGGAELAVAGRAPLVAEVGAAGERGGRKLERKTGEARRGRRGEGEAVNEASLDRLHSFGYSDRGPIWRRRKLLVEARAAAREPNGPSRTGGLSSELRGFCPLHSFVFERKSFPRIF